MTRRYALRDDQWERIKDLLPGRKGTVGVTAKDNHCLSKLCCIATLAGIPWRDLPERARRFPGGSHPFQSMGKARRVATGI